MAHRNNRFILWGVLALALGGGLGFAFWPRPAVVEVARVERGALVVTVDEEGETRIRDVYSVSAPISGDLQRIEIEAGDHVIAGETIVARLHPTNPEFLDIRTQTEREAAVRVAEANVALADAEVARAKAELNFARADLTRARALRPSDTISARALERAEIEVKTREAAHAAALAALEARRSELERARAAVMAPAAASGAALTRCCVDVTAPVTGQVLRVLREDEGFVVTGTPLVEIGNSDELEVITDLLSTDAVKVAPGARVIVSDWGGGGDLDAHVRRVEPYGFTKVSALGIEEQRVNVLVDFDSPAEARRALGHGFRVEARIVVWETADAVKVPLAALFHEGDSWAAFRLVGTTAQLTTLDVGRRNAREAEILAGLAPGDLVIVHPSDTVADGAYVKPRVIPVSPPPVAAAAPAVSAAPSPPPRVD